MAERVLIFGDASQMGTDAEVEAEYRRMCEDEACVYEADSELVEIIEMEDYARKRGRKGLKKIT